jgi:ElaB/YqjD/DUF883 family membrane-anchored ribosome-binding protein
MSTTHNDPAYVDRTGTDPRAYDPSNSDPDAIRADIDRTRGRLSDDVDLLAESVRPSSVARRTGQRVSSRASRLKDTVMGNADSATTSGSERAHDAVDTVKATPDMAMRQTRGNPLGAGAVALAAGWLVGSLLPATRKERELASSAKDQAQPLVDEATSAAKETAEHLRGPAQEAAESVKESAREGAQSVKQDSTSAAQGVRETAEGSSRGASGTAGP